MLNKLIVFVATGFGAGRVAVAPGLAGSVVGLGYWWLLMRLGNVWLIAASAVAVVAFAVWCAGEAESILRQQDPPRVVIDEIAAVPLALVGLGQNAWKIAAAFVLFRVYDVLKPPPIRQAQLFQGGVGIVLDDLLAALFACGSTHLIVWAVSRFSH